MKEKMDIIDKAMHYAIKCHMQTNHLYNGLPYEYHLEMVYEQARKFSHLVLFEQRDNFLAAAWCHDLIEDCRQTYNDVLKVTNKEVAELAYALTNEKGKNRKERANGKYYSDMKKVENAVLLKVCDRLANFEYSIETKSRMAEIYAKENESFMFDLNDGSCDKAFKALSDMCEKFKLSLTDKK